MKKQTRITLFGAVLAALVLPAAAQTTSVAPAQSTTTAPAQTSTTAAPPKGTRGPESGQQIQNRRRNQQNRISQGIASGQLTAGEASNLEKKESQLNQEEKNMRQLDNGHLTKADRATLQQQQNQLSKQIYQDKHNSAQQTPDPKSKVGQRAENQQERIASGLKNGRLDASQTSHLENEERNINKEVAKDRAANGGHLTQQEKAQINRQQNHVSKQIYRDKHSVKPQHK